jgi:DNA-binding PadR family transcriptional regulator
VRGAILIVLADAPRNGYQIMQELAQRSGGTWRPSSGSIYPTLQQLEDEGLVEITGSNEPSATGRIYKLSDRGKSYVGKHRSDLEGSWMEQGEGVEDPRAEAGALMRALGAAVYHVLASGTPEQTADMRRRIAELRRELYGMLAQAPDDEDV